MQKRGRIIFFYDYARRKNLKFGNIYPLLRMV